MSKSYEELSHRHCWAQTQPPACGMKGPHKRCCLCSKLPPDPTQTLDTEKGIEVAFDLCNKIWNQNGKHTHAQLDELITMTLTSFEAKIRTDEADKCNDHIEKALTAERTRLHAAIEKMGYTFKTVGWGDGMTSIEPVESDKISRAGAEGFNAALTRIKDLINKDI